MNYFYRINLFFICILISTLFSCSDSTPLMSRMEETKRWKADNGKIKILNTISMIDDLVKEVGGEYVSTFTLIKGDLDPHSYQPVKGDDEKFAFADIIFFNGLGLEHSQGFQYLFQTHKAAIGLGDEIRKTNPDKILDVNGQPDPHIWLDASLWSETIPIITKALVNQDPEHAQYYTARAEELTKKLGILHQDARKKMEEVPQEQRYLVATHDAFNYFSRAYLSDPSELANGAWQYRFVAPEGLAPECQLSTHDIQTVLNHIKKYKVKVIFAESNVNRDSIEKIVLAAKEHNWPLYISDKPLYGDAMGPTGSEGDTYQKMIGYNIKVISEMLRK